MARINTAYRIYAYIRPQQALTAIRCNYNLSIYLPSQLRASCIRALLHHAGIIIDVAFQPSMSSFPDATVAMGHATGQLCKMPLWLQALHEFVSFGRMWRSSPPQNS